jgi:Rap1a immunity proteins
MKTILKPLAIAAMSIATLISAANAASPDSVGLSTNKLLSMCKSGEDWQRTACFTYVAATRDAYTFMAITSIKGPEEKQTKIAGICMPTNVKLPLDDLISWTDQLVQEWRAKMDGKLDPMGEMTAAGVILASIRARWPCPK